MRSVLPPACWRQRRTHGGRRLVARAVARAALVSADYSAPALAFGGLGVPARGDALLAEPPSRLPATVALASVAGLALFAVGGSTLQVHHLLASVSAVCTMA
jgi:hypothetical protein